MAAAILVTGSVVVLVWAVRRRLACMTAMMLAMAMGMVAGLVAGAVAGLARPDDLWWATVAGSITGIAVGGATGLAVSLMALMDGALSGLMGGMMGAMLGTMAPDRAEAIQTAGAALAVATAALATVLVCQEAGAPHVLQTLRRLMAPPRSGIGRVVVAAAMATAAGAGSFFSASPGAGPPPAVGFAAGLHQGHGGGPVRETIREVRITAREFAFDLPVIEVARGERIRLRLLNTGRAEHDISIPGLPARLLGAHAAHGGTDVHAHARPGEEVVVDFVPLESGLFPAVCTLPGHQGQGMQMQVEVY